MKRVSVLAGLLVALLTCSCGGLRAADLFIVYRSGTVAGARLTLLVNEEGGVHCNGGPVRKISNAQLVEARGIQEELEKPSSEHVFLRPRRGSVLSYYVRDPNGTVRFSDNSAAQPAAFRQLGLLVLNIAQHVCRLPM